MYAALFNYLVHNFRLYLFQKEYPNAAAKLMTQVEHVKGTIKFSKNSDNASARTYKGTFAVGHGMWKGELVKEDGRGLVICSGGEKEFLIVKNNQTAEYFIADLRRADTAGNRPEVYDELQH